jgi:Heterokaryon incompatibility protein (HET)
MANIAWFRSRGAFRSDNEKISQTIRDAVGLSKALGKRYLWVDAVCIEKDNIDDRQTSINCMDWIFNNALLTICATVGYDANAGLPGCSTNAERCHRQPFALVDDMILGSV